jgi:hypothetical protein
MQHFRRPRSRAEGVRGLGGQQLRLGEQVQGLQVQGPQVDPDELLPGGHAGHTMDLIEKHGRMRWDNPVWVERLRRRSRCSTRTGSWICLPYFMIDEEVCDLYGQRQADRPGPWFGRRHAAGVPAAHHARGSDQVQLSMERFLTASRIQSGKLPDIDQDLPDRDLLGRSWPEGAGSSSASVTATPQISTWRRGPSSSARRSRTWPGFGSTDGRSPRRSRAARPEVLENAPQGISDYDFVFGYKGSDGWVEGIAHSEDPALRSTSRSTQPSGRSSRSAWA